MSILLNIVKSMLLLFKLIISEKSNLLIRSLSEIFYLSPSIIKSSFYSLILYFTYSNKIIDIVD